MQLVVSLVLLLACFIAAGNCQSGVPCPSVVGEPSCVCNHPDGKGLIDLRPIANPQNDPSGPKYVFHRVSSLSLSLPLLSLPPSYLLLPPLFFPSSIPPSRASNSNTLQFQHLSIFFLSIMLQLCSFRAQTF